MTKERAMRLAAKWANGGVCTLREGEAQEYHELCLAALRKSRQEWISVHEELPQKTGEYLVYTKEGRVGLTFWYSEPFVTYVEITHWMPLPEPPYIGDENQ